MKYYWAPVLALIALTACEEEAPEVVATETGGEAVGEVLGGTISDDMIPLEELTSTSPPAERRAAAPSGDSQAASEEEGAPEVSAPAPEPVGPITAGPGLPTPETPEAEPPAGGPTS